MDANTSAAGTELVDQPPRYMTANAPTMPEIFRIEDHVQFIGKSPYKWKQREQSEVILIYTALSCMALWVWTGVWAAGLLGGSTSVVVALVPTPVALWLGWLFVRSLRTKAMLRAQADREASISSRIVCVALPAWIHADEAIEDLSFEPDIFFTLDKLQYSRLQRGSSVLIYIVFAAVVFSSAQLLGSNWDGFPLIKCWGAALAAHGFERVILWPNYFRITPGRLDLMRFNNLPGGRTVTKSIPLRDAHLLIDLHRNTSLITVNGESTEVPFLLVRDRRRFARCLIRAALSTHVSPSLPDDELLG